MAVDRKKGAVIGANIINKESLDGEISYETRLGQVNTMSEYLSDFLISIGARQMLLELLTVLSPEVKIVVSKAQLDEMLFLLEEIMSKITESRKLILNGVSAKRSIEEILAKTQTFLAICGFSGAGQKH